MKEEFLLRNILFNEQISKVTKLSKKKKTKKKRKISDPKFEWPMIQSTGNEN